MLEPVVFPSATVNYHFQSSFAQLWDICDPANTILVTDATIAELYPDHFKSKKVIVTPPGEQSKDLATISRLADDLLRVGATRKTTLVGVGGGVITDLTGFLASVYMRGVRFGFVPTTLLAMVDAAIGGKNGVNLGLHKNILGAIRQPEFILYDTSLLQTLPDAGWSNGFAEIIKYGLVFDAGLLAELSANNIQYYRQHANALQSLIERCATWKNKVVAADEHERGDRKLLNFGHTAGHAIETLCSLPHGCAVAIGMIIACLVSEKVMALSPGVIAQLRFLLQRYYLPVRQPVNVPEVMTLLKSDKKRVDDMIDFIVLAAAGHGVIRTLTFDSIEKALLEYESNS